MKRSIFETILGAVVLVIAGSFLFLAYQKTDIGQPVQGYKLYASFSSAEGLKPGVDVRVAGVKVGSVTKIKLDGASYQAIATLQLNNGVKVPNDSTAQIASESLLGGKFIALQIGGADETIPPGGKFEYTQAAANLEALLGQAIFSRQGGGNDNGAPAPAAPLPTETPAAPVTAPAPAAQPDAAAAPQVVQ